MGAAVLRLPVNSGTFRQLSMTVPVWDENVYALAKLRRKLMVDMRGVFMFESSASGAEMVLTV